MEVTRTYYYKGQKTLEDLIDDLDVFEDSVILNISETHAVYDPSDLEYIPVDLLDRDVRFSKRELTESGWMVTVVFFKEKTETLDEKLLKEFIGYLKEHSCMYDFDTTGHYCSFRAVDVDDMDDMLEEFMEGKV
jgi:hypothetical protein